MRQDPARGEDRRDFLKGSALLALVLGLPLAACNPARILGEDKEPSAAQRTMIRDVAQLVIPRTDTAGAGEAGVGDFVILALALGLENARAQLPAHVSPDLAAHRRDDDRLDHLGWLEAELDRRAGGPWLKRDDGVRTRALTALDDEAYAEGMREHPWRTIKSLILTGYYTTELGGSKELRFELVPGRFDPDVPVTPETRAYSSDWTAVDFG